MTRVLFLTESYHPVLGGGEVHIRGLSSRLAASGFPATVLTRRTDAGWPAEEMDGGVRVLRVGPSGPGRGGKYAMVPRAVAALRRERGTYDVVVVRGTRVLGLPGLLTGRLLGKAVVLQAELNGEMAGDVYTWGTPLDRPAVRPFVRAVTGARNLLLRDADAFVAMSRRIRDEFVEAGVPAERVALIPHGVDTDRFRPATARERVELRQALHLPAGGVLITYTGRLLRGKGLEALLDAFATAAASEPRVHLLLVGSGAGQTLSVEDALKARVGGHGLASRVTFAGRVENVEDWLRASDVFAFPSVFEALGISLVEAAACGLPCVGSRTGGIVDVVEDGASGLLVDPGHSENLGAALRALVADPVTRARMGERSRALALARFDSREAVDRYRALFAEVTARSRPGASPPARAARADAAPRR